MDSFVIKKREISPGNFEYAWNHILTQETIYGLMLPAQLTQMHKAVAEWIEMKYQANLSVNGMKIFN